MGKKKGKAKNIKLGLDTTIKADYSDFKPEIKIGNLKAEVKKIK